MGSERAPKYPVQAVRRALSIIQMLAANPGQRPLGVTEIATRLGTSKSTTHRLLSTLAEFNMVAKDEDVNKYRLGWSLYELATNLPRTIGLDAVAVPLMAQASDELHETVNLAVRQVDKAVIIESFGPSAGLKVDAPKGSPFPMHGSALGKALLLDFSSAALRQLLGGDSLPVTTPRTLNSVAGLNEDLILSRRRGYTLDEEEMAEGVFCVGAPVRDYRSEIVAAVSVTGPTQRLTGEKFSQAVEKVRSLSLDISKRLGFQGEATA